MKDIYVIFGAQKDIGHTRFIEGPKQHFFSKFKMAAAAILELIVGHIPVNNARKLVCRNLLAIPESLGVQKALSEIQNVEAAILEKQNCTSWLILDFTV